MCNIPLTAEELRLFVIGNFILGIAVTESRWEGRALTSWDSRTGREAPEGDDEFGKSRSQKSAVMAKQGFVLLFPHDG